MDIYATHLPVLKEIGRLFPIMNVLELGAGSYSTASFCSGDFPTVRRVDSYETDKGWYESLAKTIIHPALSLVHSVRPLAEVVPGLDLNLYDLIFVDDGQSKQERVNTIVAVTEKRPKGIIVIHDFEQPEYQNAVCSHLPSWCWSYTKLTPNTGVIVPLSEFIQINVLVDRLELARLW